MRATLEHIATLRAEYPDNLALRHFESDYIDTLTVAEQRHLLACIRSGLANPDSQMGCYAQMSEDYDRFRPFFSALVARHHQVRSDQSQQSDWVIKQTFDLADFTLPTVSMRLRAARNFSDLPLPAAMSRADRVVLEQRMIGVFGQLASVNNAFRGRYYSLTEDSEFQMDEGTHQRFIERHLMFSNLEDDRFLSAAGIGSDWPTGRGFYLSDDNAFMVWVGEEDHLRVVLLENGTCLGHLFSRLKNALDELEMLAGRQFAVSDHFGIITSCPTNVGTGFRASVHLKLPGLLRQSDESSVKSRAHELGLSVRGVHGEHTQTGVDGTVDLSPSQRFGVSEAEIIKRLYSGVGKLWRTECSSQSALA